MSGIYRYCPMSRLEDAEKMGWVIVGQTHRIDYYAWLIFWPCSCQAPWFAPCEEIA